MAREEALHSVSIPASADLSASQFCFMTVNSSGKLAATGAAVAADGVLQDKPAADGRPGQLGIAGVSKVRAGAGFTAGDDLASDSTGRAVTATSGDVVTAKALEDASGVDVVATALLKLQAEPLA